MRGHPRYFAKNPPLAKSKLAAGLEGATARQSRAKPL